MDELVANAGKRARAAEWVVAAAGTVVSVGIWAQAKWLVGIEFVVPVGIRGLKVEAFGTDFSVKVVEAVGEIASAVAVEYTVVAAVQMQR